MNKLQYRFTDKSPCLPKEWTDMVTIDDPKNCIYMMIEGKIEFRIKPQPEPENKFLKAYREGKRVQLRSCGNTWIDYHNNPYYQPGDANYKWRILTTRTVPLTIADVMPGMVLKNKGGESKFVVVTVSREGVWMGVAASRMINYHILADKYDRWNGTEWIPCHKTEEVVEE